MINHHPTNDLLVQFASGDLDASLASVVSTHIENCSRCQMAVKNQEKSLSQGSFSTEANVTHQESNLAWAKISARMDKSLKTDVKATSSRQIEIGALKCDLPRALRKMNTDNLKWLPFGVGGKICTLGKEGKKSLFLIYLASNEEVPLHSHEGAEYSCVISGSFHADGNEYKTGDFSISTESIIHSPKAGSEDGCLLLSSVENRLNFLQGWLKPFNGLLWWFLHFRTKWM